MAVEPKVTDPPAHLHVDADGCSSEEIDPNEWKLQCEDNRWALFCDQDGQQKKCACRKNGKYYYTYGANCAHLPCFHKVCS
jgi:hypothetical protein